MKYQLVTAVVAFLALSVCCTSFTAEPAIPTKDGPQKRPYVVQGRLNEDDLQQLEKLVGKLTKDKILSIDVMKASRVEVITGVVRGPLNGGGQIYEFEKKNGAWARINKNTIRSWVS